MNSIIALINLLASLQFSSPKLCFIHFECLWPNEKVRRIFEYKVPMQIPNGGLRAKIKPREWSQFKKCKRRCAGGRVAQLRSLATRQHYYKVIRHTTTSYCTSCAHAQIMHTRVRLQTRRISHHKPLDSSLLPLASS